MSENHDCTCYPDQARKLTVSVRQNVRIARDTYRIRLDCPEIARLVLPGQFVMVRLPHCTDPLLGRPLAAYDVVLGGDGQVESLDLVYLVVGKMTGLLAAVEPGAKLEVWGPLGNGFPPEPTEHLLMVAGGIGQTPFLTLAQEYLGLRSFGDPARRVPPAEKVTLCYGARSEEYLAGQDDFRRLGVELRVATDDGSAGHHGLVTELIGPAVEQSGSCRIVCCGPEPMLKATAAIARRLGVPCQVSLETAMACGMGICFSCVVRVRDTLGNWDYRRTCVDGPIFNAEEVDL